MEKGSNAVYFPSLNGLRFIAATLVFIHHFPHIKCVMDTGFMLKDSFLKTLGGTGVTLFFVLSGFLITYLLLTEHQQINTIDIKKFYVRRLLRIWPLYFLILGVYLMYGYFANELSPDFFKLQLALYLFFLPNVAHTIFASGGFPMQLWSVGSEEQFYLFYPWLVKYFRSTIIYYLCITPLVFIAIRGLLLYITLHYSAYNWHGVNIFQFLFDFSNAFRIDCMAVGGLFAYLLFTKHKLLAVVYSTTTQYIVYVVIALLVATSFNQPLIYHTVFSILFGSVILNLASNKNSVLSLENIFFNHLGKLSYGLYMIHSFVQHITDVYFQRYLTLNNAYATVAITFVVTFVASIGLAQLSYSYFETPFLKFKHKFSIITSGNDVKHSS